jgi:mannose-6-phosphate isomerase-like protein (cupin superfamily)
MIDRIVVVSCGKGSRLNPITCFIPKILVNLNNENILTHIISYWKLYCNNFIILINKEYNSYIEFYLSNYPSIKYEIRNIDIDNNEENSYTIKNGLRGLDNLNLLLTWCDIFPNEPIDFTTINTNTIFINNYYNYTSRYYAQEPNILKKVDNHHDVNVIGIYYIKNYKNLVNKNDTDDICDCYVDNYHTFQTYELNKIIDIGDMIKLKSYNNTDTFNSRFFNTITKISSTVLEKKSNCLYGERIINDEINFYKYIQDNNIIYPIQHVFNITDNSFHMTYIDADTVYKSILKHKNVQIIYDLFLFLNNIYNYNQKSIPVEILRNDLYIETIYKINKRHDSIKTILKEFLYIKYVNYVKINSYETIIERVTQIIDNFIDNNKNLKYNVLHGDLNLSNIFTINKDKYKFIDPRGYFGNSKIYGLNYYELSKIYISLFGYDTFNNNNEYFFTIYNDNIITNIDLLFDTIYIFSNYTLEESQFIICLAISVWLGIPYYFKNNLSKLIGSHFYSLYLATIYLDSIESLIKTNKIKYYKSDKTIINNSDLNKNIYELTNKIINKQEFNSYRNLVVRKPWGFEFVCSEFPNISILILHIKNGEETSMHVHTEKDTPMILAQGKLKVKTLDNEYNVNVGEIIIINRKIYHQLCSYSDDTILIEFEMFNPNKNDLIRYKDKYGRKNLSYESKTNILIDANNHCNDYFEYYDDTDNNVTKTFLSSRIEFKRDHFDQSIKDNTIIVILKGCINVEGIYLSHCSIIKGKELVNKSILILSDDFRYLQYDLL